MPSPFVAQHTSTATSPPDGTVDADGWWPAIDVADLRKATRIDATVTPERLHQAVVWAVQSVMGECAEWQDEQIASGHATLGDVPARQVDGSSVKLIQYRTAVYACVQAQMLEQYLDIDTTRAGERRIDALDDRTGLAQRTMRNAVADLLGRTRWRVEAL